MKRIKSPAFIVLIILSGLIFTACGSKSDNSNANANTETQIIEVNTAMAKVVDIPTYFEATGSLASDAQSDVAPNINGKIVSVNFDIGSYVNRGDVMVKLDARDAQIRLEQAQAQVQQQQKVVEQAEAGVNQAIANLRQTQARLGVGDNENFDIETFSQVVSIKAQLELAEKQLRRFENLLESGDISRAQYDQQKAQRDQLLGQLSEARSNAAVAVKAISTAQAQVDAARAQVGNAKAAVASAQTQVDAANKAINDNTIFAPISGYVSAKNAEVGEYLSQNAPNNAPLATIVRTAVLRLQIDVPEQSIDKVGVGQSVSAQVSAYPDRTFGGRIVRVAPSLNVQSRTLTVEAEIENVNGLLKPGQFATVRITQSKPEPAVMIPASAVRVVGEQNLVYVIKDGVANERLVQTGLLEDNMIEIKQNIQENEVVATSSIDKLSDGVIVNAVN